VFRDVTYLLRTNLVANIAQLHLLRLPSQIENDIEPEAGGGIRCDPIGIVTLNDIIKRVLQTVAVDSAPSVHAQPPTMQYVKTTEPAQAALLRLTMSQSNWSGSGTLRQRHVSSGKPKIAGMDGADERSNGSSQNSHSSYTLNRDGGFRGTMSSRFVI
jgi:hypothetical protein